MGTCQNESRFTGRVESYRQFRPGYPKEIVQLLQQECGLSKNSTIVDVAAGTGLFTELFLENGNTVIAVEPNAEMRSACAKLTSRYPNLSVIKGTAEQTALQASIADFITVAQAMHWFDLRSTRQEFARILKSNGWCVVAYNDRRREGDSFHEGYEQLLVRYGADYAAVQHSYVKDDSLRPFFEPHPMRKQSFRNFQLLNREGLTGRILSSSYMPSADHPDYANLLQAIHLLFENNQRDGLVQLEYDCTIRYGQLA